MKNIIELLNQDLTVEKIIKQITPRGNGKYIKKNKPKNGIYAYIWRMCRFHNGEDPCMPVTANWDLSNGIKETYEMEYGFLFKYSEEEKAVVNLLNKLVDDTLDKLGHDKNAAAKRWKGLLY